MNTYDFFHSLKGNRPILGDLSFITWGEGGVEDFGGHMVFTENGVGISLANRV